MSGPDSVNDASRVCVELTPAELDALRGAITVPPILSSSPYGPGGPTLRIEDVRAAAAKLDEAARRHRFAPLPTEKGAVKAEGGPE